MESDTLARHSRGLCRRDVRHLAQSLNVRNTCGRIVPSVVMFAWLADMHHNWLWTSVAQSGEHVPLWPVEGRAARDKVLLQRTD